MSSDDRGSVEAALKKKLADLLSARADVREQIAGLSRRDREIDRELADARAAARLFGVALEFPDEANEPPPPFRLVRDSSGRIFRQRTHADGTVERIAFPKPQPNAATLAGSGPPKPPASLKAIADQQPLPTPSPPPRPPIKDLVLDRLRAAAGAGSKAKPIRDFIERVYAESIHEKTVGMTLYRLAKDGLVRREGRTWFLAKPEAETRNPAGSTAGLEDLLK